MLTPTAFLPGLPRSRVGSLYRVGLMATMFLGLAGAAGAQVWPAGAKPITLVVGNVSGGGTDVITRILAERLQSHLQKPVVVENKPGASGTLAAALVARAPTDGHTLLVTPITLVTTPHVLAKAGAAPVDVLTDLAPVVQLTKGTLLLVANPARGIKDAKALVGVARQRPDLSYGTPGSGSPMHIAGEAFKKAAGVPLTHVPYKGVAPALADLLGDHVTVVFSDLASANVYLQSGKLVAIGVTQAQRSPLLADVPTLTEQGFPGVELTRRGSACSYRPTRRRRRWRRSTARSTRSLQCLRSSASSRRWARFQSAAPRARLRSVSGSTTSSSERPCASSASRPNSTRE